MSNLRARLKRLEQRQPTGRKTFEQAMADFLALESWLAERGYQDSLAALEAGETGPEGLQELLREQAAYDPKRRAWARIRAALDANRLPDEADLKTIQSWNRTTG